MLGRNERVKELAARSEKAQKEGFQQFLERPLVKTTLARMPSTENNEIIELLRATYECGFATGQGEILIELLTRGA